MASVCFTLMTVSSIIQLCSEIESLSGLLPFVCRDSNVSSHCLCCFRMGPSYDSWNEPSPRALTSANSWQQSTISSLHSATIGKIQAPKNYFVGRLPVYVSLNSKSTFQYQMSEDTCLFFGHGGSDKHDGKLLGRFSLSQHYITLLIWSHFAWLHPGWLPVGAQQGRHLDRRSLLLVSWQDAGSVSHWLDPLSSLLSPVPSFIGHLSLNGMLPF